MRDPEVERRRQEPLVEDMIVILQNIRHLPGIAPEPPPCQKS
jgi:hypothetical protein